MSNDTTPVVEIEADSSSSSRMVFTMGGIGLIAGILIVLTFQMTFPIIKVNKAVALERSIFQVVPDAVTKTAFMLVNGTLRPLQEDEEASAVYYACYDNDGRLVGVAVEAQGQGFQDILRILYGYSPARNSIIGMTVLESKETPGLGDRIETDPAFRSNFDALTVTLNPGTDEIVNPIIMVKHGKKIESWQVEAITGATISSRAIATILRESTVTTIPVITRNLTVLEQGRP